MPEPRLEATVAAGGDRLGELEFPHQREVVALASGYELTAADRRQVVRGRSLYLTGRVLACLASIAECVGGIEFFAYLLARPEEPFVACDLELPRQEVSAAHCEVPPRSVIASARAARSRSLVVVGAAHGHGHLAVSTSAVDELLQGQLASEKVGFAGRLASRRRGKVHRSTGDGEGERLVLTFPGAAPEVRLTLPAGTRLDSDLDPVSVELVTTSRSLVSFFGTTNARRQFHFPSLLTVTCGGCGGKTIVAVPPEEVAVHVLGAVEVTEGERRRLQTEIDKRVCEARYVPVSGAGLASHEDYGRTH